MSEATTTVSPKMLTNRFVKDGAKFDKLEFVIKLTSRL